MITSKTAFFLIVTVIILGFGIYFVSRGSSKGSLPPDCSHCGNKKCDPVTGECLPDPILCNGIEKPADTDSCKYVCVRGKWLCKGSDPCENSYIPSNIDSCELKDLVCDPTSKTLYCPKDTKCNGFDGYFIRGAQNTKCACDPSLGPTCNCDPKMCGQHGKNAGVDANGDCICICNDPAHFFGPKCDESCHIDGMININGTCKCDPAFYTQTGNVCVPIPCINGTKDPKTGHCTCNNGFTPSGPNGQCVSNCTVNQVWDSTANKCVCKPNTDFSGVDSPTNNGTQYSPTRDGKDCNVYHCHYASEFANGKCNCKDDSCGQNCQYTRQNVCNGNGKPNCDGSGIFINCTCDAGFYGEDCSCQGLPSGVTDPSLLVDHCKGVTDVCKNGQWTTMYKDCDDIQLYFGQDFQTQCFDENCNSSLFYQKVGTLTCNDPASSGQQATFTCKGCPSNLSSSNCPAGQVQICDASPESNYNWVCKNQIHANGNCPPSPPSGSLCIDTNGNPAQPSCFQCGPNGGSEWFCENQGSIPSMECLQNVGVESASFSGYSGEIYLNNSLNNSLPIFPTTDYDSCVSYMKDYTNPNNTLPYNNGQIGNFNISKNLTNPIGMINKETNTFTPIAGNRYFDIVNGTTDAKCILSDGDVAKYILKNPGKLCNGNGTFVQDKDQNGRYLPSGKCSCETDFKGNICQFSNSITCSGQGKVDDNGNCICNSGYGFYNTCIPLLPVYAYDINSANAIKFKQYISNKFTCIDNLIRLDDHNIQLIFFNNYPQYINNLTFEIPGVKSVGTYNNILTVNTKDLYPFYPFYSLKCSYQGPKPTFDKNIVSIAVI
jgi:hypothetical protein